MAIGSHLQGSIKTRGTGPCLTGAGASDLASSLQYGDYEREEQLFVSGDRRRRNCKRKSVRLELFSVLRFDQSCIVYPWSSTSVSMASIPISQAEVPIDCGEFAKTHSASNILVQNRGIHLPELQWLDHAGSVPHIIAIVSNILVQIMPSTLRNSSVAIHPS